MRIYSQEKIFYVYQYLRSKNSKYGDIGTPYYIGKGYKKRAYIKHHKGIYVPKDKNNIQFITTNLNEADAFQLEMLLIHLYGRIDLGTGCLRNMSAGGDGVTGYIHTPQTREKISATHKGKIVSDKTKNKISVYRASLTKEQQPRFGYKYSAEEKRKMSIIATGRHLSEETKRKISNSLMGENNSFFGKHHSYETKQKQSIVKIGENNPFFGKHHSSEAKKKISDALKGKNKK